MQSSTMKTVWVIPSLQQGWRQWASFFRRLSGTSTRVTVYTMLPPPDAGAVGGVNLKLTAGRLRILRRHSARIPFGTVFAQVSSRLVNQIRREHPDVVVAIEYSLGTFWAALACKLSGAQLLIFTEHRPWAQLRRSRVTHLWRRLLTRLADGFLVNTHEAADYVTTSLAAPAGKVFFAPLISPPSRQELCQVPIPVPDPPQRPVFLFMGRLIEQKGVQFLLAAAKRLHDQGEELTLWIVGDGDYRRELERLSLAYGLGSHVRFFGAVPNHSVGCFYDKADVFVLPSLQDYLAVAVLEAMRFGKPIIVSRHAGAAHSMITHGSNGFIVDPRHPTELADHMARLMADPERIRSMGELSRERIAPYDPDNAVRLFHETTKSMMRTESWVSHVRGC